MHELNNDETLKAIRASVQEDADEDPEIDVDEIMEGVKQALIDIENGNVTPYVISSRKSPPMTTTTADEIAAVEAHFERMTANSFNVYVEFDPLEMWGDMIELAFTNTWESETKEAKTAFAAICERLRYLEAENARLKEALTEIRDRDGNFWNLNLLADRALKVEDTQSKSPPTETASGRAADAGLLR